MNRIKYHQLQQSNRLIIQSIRLELKKQQNAIQHRKRLVTVPDNHALQLFRSNTRRKQYKSSALRQSNLEEQRQKYSIPMKLNRWESIQQEEMKRIKSNILEKKLQNIIDITSQQPQIKKSIVKMGPLIFVKDMFHDGPQKIEKQQRKISNILKFKSLKGVNLIRKQKSHESFSENLEINSLKLSIDLPKLREKEKEKDAEMLRYLHKGELLTPNTKVQRALILQKSDRKKPKKFKFSELSPWSTKAYNFNPSKIAIK